MRSTTLSLLGILPLAGALGAADKQAPLQCTLTGKKIAKCCCETRDGKLYCTLAKKTIDKCCCQGPEEAKAKKAKQG